jgi:asparagine synthase (glutamine-hydrolysing)
VREASPKLSGAFSPETFLNKFHHLSRIPSPVSALLYFDVKTRLPDAYILQYERLTRAFKLCWQTPFLNRKLFEYAASLPEPEALRESETAAYLKPLLQGVFPEAFLSRPKKTRKHFLANWVDHQDIADVFHLLLKGTLVETGYISEKWLAEQLANPDQMRNAFPQLFAILTLEVWFRIFVNRTITPSPPGMSLKELLQE